MDLLLHKQSMKNHIFMNDFAHAIHHKSKKYMFDKLLGENAKITTIVAIIISR